MSEALESVWLLIEYYPYESSRVVAAFADYASAAARRSALLRDVEEWDDVIYLLEDVPVESGGGCA